MGPHGRRATRRGDAPVPRRDIAARRVTSSMSTGRKRCVLPDATACELRRLRAEAQRYLRERHRRALRDDVDAFLWARWYRLRDDVCARLGTVIAARESRRRRAARRARGLA
jgi:hypothetical protein